MPNNNVKIKFATNKVGKEVENNCNTQYQQLITLGATTELIKFVELLEEEGLGSLDAEIQTIITLDVFTFW